MTKRDDHFVKVAEYRARFRRLPTDVIRERLASGPLIKEAAISYREILEERADANGPDGMPV